MKIILEFDSRDSLEKQEYRHAIEGKRYFEMLSEIFGLFKEPEHMKAKKEFIELAQKHNVDFWR